MSSRDPPTPLLAPASPILASAAPASLKSNAAPSTPILSTQRQETTSPAKHASPRRQPRSPPRAKKVSLLKLPSLSQKMKSQRLSLQGGGIGQVKRIYPRTALSSIAPPESVGMLGKKIKEAKLKGLIANSNMCAVYFYFSDAVASVLTAQNIVAARRSPKKISTTGLRISPTFQVPSWPPPSFLPPLPTSVTRRFPQSQPRHRLRNASLGCVAAAIKRLPCQTMRSRLSIPFPPFFRRRLQLLPLRARRTALPWHRRPSRPLRYQQLRSSVALRRSELLPRSQATFRRLRLRSRIKQSFRRLQLPKQVEPPLQPPPDTLKQLR